MNTDRMSVYDVHCNIQYADSPSFWVGDEERYRPFVSQAAKAFEACHELDAATFYSAGDFGYLCDEGFSGDWLVHAETDEDGQWFGYKEFQHDYVTWCFSRVEVCRPSRGVCLVRLVWFVKHDGNAECWTDLYLPEVV